jgi:hypothetical protein
VGGDEEFVAGVGEGVEEERDVGGGVVDDEDFGGGSHAGRERKGEISE